EIGGLQSGDQYDVLQVTGQMTIHGGTLDVGLIDGFHPELADIFEILDFGLLAGSGFDTLNLQPLTAGLGWDTSRVHLDGTLSVMAVPEPATVNICGAALLLLANCYRQLRSRIQI
ncbi:hypothetical protein OAS39_08745, partial [Pirellulales bacterium]|nr:hypothetical protein [Pirellulales bacterium]